ncbi:insulin-like growth factor-binding protein complex acid labile subunit [Chrysoperla carnea]|uniref:insulin-like growth factor-binding protein complex acid labile subunit n=1 Tax=Chrysoperla carnea TaxID=189513 RepID=UPI001D094387|nr:insulin-like growth factor-binding protein complex acid labile subunit [Chrysoperla carnea]
MWPIFILVITLFGWLVPETSSGSVSFCPTGCICNDETLVVQCEKSKLDVVPITLNPQIQRLILKNNKIRTVDAAFQFYGDLQYVDLSSNHLMSMSKTMFDNQKKLQELHLNKNHIAVITNITFQGLKSLTVLNLRENYLEQLTEKLFSILPRLEELNLGQNRITSIDPLAFDGLNSLRVLYLDDNQLSIVPTAAFKPLGSLAELHVGLNGFSELNNGAFSDLEKLSVLNLLSAGLVNISEGAFSGLSGLRTLDLTDNRLTSIPTKQLAELPRLEELAIGQNEFTSIKPDSFKGLSNLRKIDITGAGQLERIEAGAFASNLNLETVILANNRKLSQIDDGALAGLPKLHRLLLRDNSLTTLSEGSASWGDIRGLELTDIPLECTCDLLWLRNILAMKNLTTVQCAGPQAVRDRQMRSLLPEEMGCAFNDPRQQAILGALCVSGVALLAGLSLTLYRYRRNVRDVVKDYKWNKRAISRKEHEYQKTFSEDEYMVRAAAAAAAHHQNHPHLAPVKQIPVTEL